MESFELCVYILALEISEIFYSQWPYLNKYIQLIYTNKNDIIIGEFYTAD